MSDEQEPRKREQAAEHGAPPHQPALELMNRLLDQSGTNPSQRELFRVAVDIWHASAFAERERVARALRDLAKAIAEFAAREQYNATEPFTGGRPDYVVNVLDLVDELCRLMPELDAQIKDWFNAAVDAAEAAGKESQSS